jgi:hypothetical protein
MNHSWPWLVLVGLGAFHGINPAMGWLFAVALGLHRKSRVTVMASLLPIALGHGLAIAAVVGLFIAAGVILDPAIIRIAAGSVLIVWALYHWRYGTRHRVRVGMRTGYAGLFLWSATMAVAHGAGLMVLPALMPLGVVLGGHSHHGEMPAQASLAITLAAVGIHTLAMLIVTGAIALLVYDWLGVAFLRHAWINFDLVWTAALIVTGAVLILI